MKAKHRFIIAVIVLGLLMTGPFVVTSALVWLDMREAERNMLTELLLSRLPVGTLMTLFGFVIGVLVLHKLFKHYVEGLLRMAETLRLMLGANRNFRVTPEGPPEVQQLAQAANDLAQQRDALMPLANQVAGGAIRSRLVIEIKPGVGLRQAAAAQRQKRKAGGEELNQTRVVIQRMRDDQRIDATALHHAHIAVFIGLFIIGDQQ